MTIRAFGAWDYVIFVICLCFSTGIGIYHAFAGGRQKTTAEYYYGNRQMGLLPVALSLLVTYQSSIFLLGYPAEIYIYGTMFWLSFGGVTIGFMLIALIIVPLFHPLEVKSSFEYLELRFKHSAPRKVASFLSVILYAIFMGLVLYGPAITLQTVTGFPLWGSLVIVAAGAIFYTSLGGFKAVIWADVFQSIIIAVGVLSLLIKGISNVGGMSNVWTVCRREGRINFSDFRVDPTVRHSVWTVILGNGVTFFGLGFNQMVIQRISSTKVMKDAQGACLCAIPGFILYGSGGCLLGLTAYAYFSFKKCDPLTSRTIESPNQILPYFVMEIFENQPGMPGVFLAALFCASLSTLSSGLNSLPTITWEDFIKPHMPSVSEAKATVIGKCLVLVYGIVAVVVAYIVLLIGGPIAQITSSVCSCIGGPICGMFILGATFKSANYKGSIVGCMFALVICLWIAIGATISGYRAPLLPPASTEYCDISSNSSFSSALMRNTSSGYDNLTLTLNQSTHSVATKPTYAKSNYFWLYKMSYLWYTTIGIIVSVSVGLIVSHITGANIEDVDDKYLFPFRRNCPYEHDVPCCKLRHLKRTQNKGKNHGEAVIPLNITSKNEQGETNVESDSTLLRRNIKEESWRFDDEENNL